MQRLHNLDKWQEVLDGHAVNFGSLEARRVRLDVNAPGPVCLYHANGNGEMTFLGRVVGRDVLEFFAEGEFSVTVDGGSCWLFTVDGEDISFEPSLAPTLTKIADRRPRNPEFELMQYHANRNLELRLAQMRRELDAEWSRRIAPAAAGAVEPQPASGGDGGSSEPVPADGNHGGAGEAVGADV